MDCGLQVMKIVFFSGGLASFVVAHHLKTTNPNDDILLYFTDTLWEDEDLYRFIYEASDKLKLPLLVHSEGVDPVELMIKDRVIYNNRLGQCSIKLKRNVAKNFLQKGISPKFETWYNPQYCSDLRVNKIDGLYFGIGYEESHRAPPIKANWFPFDVYFPLMDNIYNFDEVLSIYDIKRPRLYDQGFSHNNCCGRCVKAGKGTFLNLLSKNPKLFYETVNIESTLRDYIGVYKKYKNKREMLHVINHNYKEMMIWHGSKYKYTPNLLFVEDSDDKPTILKNMSLKELSLANCTKEDLNDIGGCGCFID